MEARFQIGQQFRTGDFDDQAPAARFCTTYGHAFDSHSYWIGRYYEVPSASAWAYFAAARRRYGISREYGPLLCRDGIGIIAWGVLLPSDYCKVKAH